MRLNRKAREEHCFKCGISSDTKKLDVHHLSYSPERTVQACRPCHTLIHRRLRRENVCSIPVSEAHRLTNLSASKRYAKKNIKIINFTETIETNAKLRELIHYNEVTGNLNYCSYFELSGVI